MKVLITNFYNFYNLGDRTALLYLKKNIEGELTIYSTCSFLDKEKIGEYGIKVAGNHKPPSKSVLAIKSILGTLATFLILILEKFGICKKVESVLFSNLNAYLNSDVVIDLGGDSFSDENGLFHTIFYSYNLLPAILFKKPYIIFSQSIGPFKNPLTRYIAKIVLSKSSLIIVREPLSLRYLEKEIGIEDVHLVPDHTFLLEKVSKVRVRKILREEGIRNSGLTVGINPSQIISQYMKAGNEEKYNSYLEMMRGVVRRLVDKGYSIILIPHVLGPKTVPHLFENINDRIVIRRILSELEENDRIHSIEKDYNPQEIKGIISKCDIFIGCRMHAIVNSISSGVPTISLAYSGKTVGLMKLMELDSLMVDVRGKTCEEVKCDLDEKIRFTIEKRKRIKKDVMRKVLIIKEKAKDNSKLLKQVINSI